MNYDYRLEAPFQERCQEEYQYEQWFEKNEESLRDAYEDYLIRDGATREEAIDYDEQDFLDWTLNRFQAEVSI